MRKIDTAWLKIELRETGIFLGWIAGMFLIAGLAWHFTRPIRAALTIRHINEALEVAGESRRLETPIRGPSESMPRRRAIKAAQLGNWYALADSEDRGVVFSIMIDGILAPFLVFVSPQGDTEQPIPLGRHSIQIIDRLPSETIRTYISRFEGVIQ
jgi:hypothetical protein